MNKKVRPLYMLSSRDPPQNERHTTTKSKRMGKDILCKWNEKKARIAVLISDKIDFKTKAIVKDKEGHYIMIKGAIQQEDIMPVNIYAPKIGSPTYIKQILMDIKGDINSKTVTVRILSGFDFNGQISQAENQGDGGHKQYTRSNGFN